MNIALKFAYNGQNFYGYARQPQLKTVEGDIIKELVLNGIIEDTKKSSFRSASRTDKGVSALSNVVSFKTDVEYTKILKLLSKKSSDIIFYGVKNLSEDFNPRYANSRQYRYFLRCNKNLDLDKIISTLSVFTGEHDFSNFARVESFKNPIRIIENIVCEITEDFLVIDFFAPSFLWNQIRRIISASLKVGQDKIKKEEVISALLNPNKAVDFNSAPAKPLLLKELFYDFEFEINQSFFSKVKRLEKRVLINV